jgi:hypothetical protein
LPSATIGPPGVPTTMRQRSRSSPSVPTRMKPAPKSFNAGAYGEACAGKPRFSTTFALISSLSLAMIAAGVPVGAPTPYHLANSNPGTVSPTVGISGIDSRRVADVTAIARSVPALTYWIADGMVQNTICTCPLSRSVSAGVVPRYGTFVLLSLRWSRSQLAKGASTRGRFRQLLFEVRSLRRCENQGCTCGSQVRIHVAFTGQRYQGFRKRLTHFPRTVLVRYEGRCSCGNIRQCTEAVCATGRQYGDDRPFRTFGVGIG